MLIIVNYTVRLSGLMLSQGKGGPEGRALRSVAIASRLFYISKDTHHSIEFCCSEDQCEKSRSRSMSLVLIVLPPGQIMRTVRCAIFAI